MSNPVKVTLYLVLAILASLSGYFALTNFSRMMAHAGERTSELEQIEPERRPAEEADAAGTNGATEVANTNLASTNAGAVVATNSSNAIVAVTNAALTATGPTNLPSAGATNVVKAKEIVPRPAVNASHTAQAKRGRIGLWAALFVISILALGLLIASDVSHYFGNKALNVLYNDEGEGQKDPDYEKAEEVWANGDHLEAIRLMREYLAKNPRQQHVSIRIAEIYEKDLKNNLAAALEYEEVLNKKLPSERWAWAAIHLCNLYFRLNQEQKGYDLLRRIVTEHPNAAAAEKARKRLEQVDGSPVEISQNEAPVSVSARTQTETPSSTTPSNLPPGFRPKK